LQFCKNNQDIAKVFDFIIFAAVLTLAITAFWSRYSILPRSRSAISEAKKTIAVKLTRQ
jgi:hypothetical protein